MIWEPSYCGVVDQMRQEIDASTDLWSFGSGIVLRVLTVGSVSGETPLISKPFWYLTVYLANENRCGVSINQIS